MTRFLSPRGRPGAAVCLAVALLLAPACVPDATSPAEAQETAQEQTGDRHTDLVHLDPDPSYGERGMVVAARREAVEAGRMMLRRGGNAVDAAVATGFALAVVAPYAGNVGGGGFIVLRQPDGAVTTIDFREDAPSGASQHVYLDDEGRAVRQRSRRGYLASGVPGTVAGLLKALNEHGSMDRATVMTPAIRLAREGFRLSPQQAETFNDRYDEFATFPVTKSYFTKGRPDRSYEPRERFVQEDLARTLERIRDEGRDGFYTGHTAALIAGQFQEHGGLITKEDLAEYEAVEREPVSVDYRGHRVYSMGPPSSGGIAIAQILNAAKMRDLGAMGFNSSETVHYLGEAMRRVFADRAKWIGDPDHVNVPTEALTSPTYMRDRMADYNSLRITPSDSVTAGDAQAFHESMETTHYSATDSTGRAISVTTTLNSSYGSKVVIDGAGFFMNNEMNDFVLKPGVPNQFGLSGTERNLVAEDRRMVSSMSPTIVEDSEGRLSMVLGSPGGGTIITTVAQTLMNVLDHGMDMEAAVTAGRIHHQWKPRSLHHEVHALPQDVVDNLEERGWTVKSGFLVYERDWGRVHAIRALHSAPGDNGQIHFHGAADPRRIGMALGY